MLSPHSLSRLAANAPHHGARLERNPMNHRYHRAASPPAATTGATLTLALLASLVMTACGGSDDTLPGAPTIGAATAGHASASSAFTAPSSTGSSAITSYTATCTDGASDQSRDGTASPVTVSGLTNGSTYSCTVVATNSAGSGEPSDAVSVTPLASGSATTSGIECSYSYDAFNNSPSVNQQSTSNWTCDTTSRVLAANGIPDHDVGTFPNIANPNTITAQTAAATYTLTPTKTDTATRLGGPLGAVGLILNGIKMDPGTAGTCDDTGTVCDPGGGSNTMTLIGWAADGFPIYARYGYSAANDAGSALKVMTGSYQTVTTVPDNRPPVETYPLGTFVQDWEYVAGAGDLDECNGRTGVTPEFPGGIYHYYATDTYPFLQRCVKGEVDAVQPPPGS
jgi:YHYH protein/Fibronectin type III domain